jgi:hypothetical protein
MTVSGLDQPLASYPASWPMNSEVVAMRLIWRGAHALESEEDFHLRCSIQMNQLRSHTWRWPIDCKLATAL